MRSKVNEHNYLFPRYEEGTIDVKNGKYDTNNQPKNSIFKYEQEGRFCLGVAKIESKNGKITGKRCQHHIRFPRDEEGNIDVKTGKYDTKNQQNRPPSSMNMIEYCALVYPISKVKTGL